jgi:CubicO group peptidase (beta-lactamase class C family)
MKRATGWLILISCLVVCQLGSTAHAEDGEPEAPRSYREAVDLLETWIESIIDFDRLPGVSIAVVHDQELVYAKGFGFADLDRKVRATPDTIYSICSISKIFTAIAVMQLRDRDKLSLDDPVSTRLPWFAPQTVGPATDPPTLGDLLRHTSGLPCEPDRAVWSDLDQLNPSRNELMARVSNLKMSYPTNTKFNYSNVGYALLGEVVSVASGMDYGEYVRQNIVEPLGLEATTTFLPDDTAGGGMAVGYGRWPRTGSRVKITNRDDRAITPAAGFASTVKDLAEFAMWQFRVLDGKDEVALDERSLREMHTSQWRDPEWGFGFSIWHMDDRTFVGHQGGCPGYKSQIILCPEEKIAVVAMINATDAPQFTLVFRAYEIMAPALKSPTVDEKPPQWIEYTGYYTADESWSEAEVVEWDGSLAVMWVPSGNPDPVGSLTRLERVEGNVFRQVGKDGELGKHYVFSTDDAGNIVAMRFNNNILRRAVR